MGRRGEIFYTPFWIPCVFRVNNYFRCKWPPQGNRAPGLAALDSGADSSSQGAGPGLLRGAECGGGSDPGPLKQPVGSVRLPGGAGPGWPIRRAQRLRSERGNVGRPAPRDPAWAAGQSRVSPEGKGQVARDRKGGVWTGRESHLLASGAEWNGGCLPLPAAHALLASAGPCGPLLTRRTQMGGRPAFLWVHDPKNQCAASTWWGQKRNLRLALLEFRVHHSLATVQGRRLSNLRPTEAEPRTGAVTALPP